MLTSIHPLGERARRQRFAVTLLAHVLGSGVGGALAGGVAGGAGALAGIDRSAVWVALAAALVLASAIWEALSAPVPGPRRQVNEDWLATYRGWVYGGGFGLQLGAGITTLVTTTSVYAALGVAFVTAHPASGATVGAAFGLARGLTVLATARVDTPAALRERAARITAAAPAARTAVIGGLVVVGGALTVSAVAA